MPTRKPKKCFRIELRYPAKLYFDTNIEARIQKAAGYSSGSGMGFGQRDHSWYPKTEKAAKKKLAQLRKLKSIKGLKVQLYTEDC
jgi:hypothetical protein